MVYLLASVYILPELVDCGLYLYVSVYTSRRGLCVPGGGGANTKVPDMYGVGGGVFGTQNTKVTCTLYNKGGCPYFIPNHKSINGTFVHTFHNKIIKNYEKMTNSIVFIPTFIYFSMNYYYKK